MAGGLAALAVALAVSRQQSARQVHGRPPVLSALCAEREDEVIKQTAARSGGGVNETTRSL